MTSTMIFYTGQTPTRCTRHTSNSNRRVQMTAHYPTHEDSCSKPTRSTDSHLIDTSHTTAVLVSTINTPHSTESTRVKYANWKPIPPNPVFLQIDTPTEIYRKHAWLYLINAPVVRMIRQVQQQLLYTIIQQRTYTINHNINISQLQAKKGRGFQRLNNAFPLRYELVCKSHAP